MGQPQLPPWAELALDLLAWAYCQAPLTQEERDALVSRRGDSLPRLATRKIDSLYYLAAREHSPAQRLYAKIWKQQRNACFFILQRLQKSEVPAILFKGAEFISAWYNSEPLGLMYDIDILLPRRFLGIAKQILYAEGYRQLWFDETRGELIDRDVRAVARIESTHYELAPFTLLCDLVVDAEELEAAKQAPEPVWVVGERCRVRIEFDIHHGVASDLPAEPFFKRAVPSATGLALTMCPTDQLWLTLTRLYVEVAIHGKSALRDFAYLLPMLKGAEIDWELFCALAREHRLRSSLFYYLHFLDHLTHGVVPRFVLERLNPMPGTRLKDWGWQLGKLLDILDPYPLDGYRFRYGPQFHRG